MAEPRARLACPVKRLSPWIRHRCIRRTALLGNLARSLISRRTTAGLWIGAAWRAGHASAARICLTAGSALAGGCWLPLSLLLHRRLTLGCGDAGRCDQDGRC
jgi:hypothetical protein